MSLLQGDNRLLFRPLKHDQMVVFAILTVVLGGLLSCKGVVIYSFIVYKKHFRHKFPHRKMASVEEFRKGGKELIDYVADYMQNIRDRQVKSSVSPGYLAPLVPAEAPELPEEWSDVFKDIERVIMPGVTHWSHPNFFGYFASASQSCPAILGDILSGAIACVGFSWNASPACTELEMVMMDWLAKLLDLPEHFLFSSEGKGGGVIQGTASEATLVSMLTARSRYTKTTNKKYIDCPIGKLVAYCSNQAHSSVERAAMLAGVQIRNLPTDENYSLRGSTLKSAIEEDKAKGLVPFHCTATLGTTTSCAFDNLQEIGVVCEAEGIWLHVDAAYAGSAFICEEFRHYKKGIEYADSFNFNLHKWLLVNFDCAAMYLKNSEELVGAFNVDPLYLQHKDQDKIPDYRHWQIPLGRRFRSLKIWFTLRLYGKKGLQDYVRKHIILAKELEKMILNDATIFEIVAPVVMGLVCFRVKGENKITEKLFQIITEEGRIYLVPGKLDEKFMLRFALVNQASQIEDIQSAYTYIKEKAIEIMT